MIVIQFMKLYILLFFFCFFGFIFVLFVFSCWFVFYCYLLRLPNANYWQEWNKTMETRRNIRFWIDKNIKHFIFPSFSSTLVPLSLSLFPSRTPSFSPIILFTLHLICILCIILYCLSFTKLFQSEEHFTWLRLITFIKRTYICSKWVLTFSIIIKKTVGDKISWTQLRCGCFFQRRKIL